MIPCAEDAEDAEAEEGEDKVATTLPVDFVASAIADIKIEGETDEPEPRAKKTA